MGRRSDHSREELRELILSTGSKLLAEIGLTRFSSREVARRIGYTVGTVHNVFNGADRLIIAINTRTFDAWAAHLRGRLADFGTGDRLAALVDGYFEFARSNVHLWTAIYDHHLPPGMTLPDADERQRSALTHIVVTEVARALDRPVDERVATLTRSLIAVVHGHCAYAISGAWALMGQAAPEVAALTRVREAVAALRLSGPV